MNADSVISRCYGLAAHSEEPGVTTRPFLVPSARRVHDALSAWMQQAGMKVRVDAAGNLLGVYEGNSSEGKTPRRLLIGSHLDTVPDAGAFDGVLGVVLAIALVEM